MTRIEIQISESDIGPYAQGCACIMIGAGDENLSPTEKDESPEYNFNRPPLNTSNHSSSNKNRTNARGIDAHDSCCLGWRRSAFTACMTRVNLETKNPCVCHTEFKTI
jgi:hypothetical protein